MRQSLKGSLTTMAYFFNSCNPDSTHVTQTAPGAPERQSNNRDIAPMACSTEYFEDDLFPQNILADPMDDFLKNYFERLNTGESFDAEDKTIRLIARAPDSHASHVLLYRASDLEKYGVRVEVIFSQIAPADCIERWAKWICNDNYTYLQSILRWAKKPQLLDAHEQLILGKSMCWSGDVMKRRREQRNQTDIYEHNAPGATRMAVQTFKALWQASSQATISQLKSPTHTPAGKKKSLPPKDHVLENWASNFHHVISTRH